MEIFFVLGRIRCFFLCFLLFVWVVWVLFWFDVLFFIWLWVCCVLFCVLLFCWVGCWFLLVSWLGNCGRSWWGLLGWYFVYCVGGVDGVLGGERWWWFVCCWFGWVGWNYLNLWVIVFGFWLLFCYMVGIIEKGGNCLVRFDLCGCRVKILVMLGFVSCEFEMIGKLFRVGVDVFCVNMSYGD